MFGVRVYDSPLENNVFILSCSGSTDLPVESRDRYTDGEDFDGTHQVDHLALLGTAASVRTRSILFSFLLSASTFITRTHGQI